MRKPKRYLKLNSLPFDITCHPSRELTAVSNIEGEIIFLSLQDDISKLDTIQHHTDSCRRILFSDTSLLSISSDKAFVVCDIETRKVEKKFADAHENPLYALCEVRDGKVFATGDDEGVCFFA
jgi:WD40 repeat protein